MSRHQAYRNLDFDQELADYDYRDEGDYDEQNYRGAQGVSISGCSLLTSG